jgi:hypothetical protein
MAATRDSLSKISLTMDLLRKITISKKGEESKALITHPQSREFNLVVVLHVPLQPAVV